MQDKTKKPEENINESTIFRFLAVIEKRTNDLITLYNELYNNKVNCKQLFIIKYNNN